jgi:hypothetical protein
VRVVLAVAVVLAVGAAPARAATFCVAAPGPGCAERPTVAAALASAAGEPGTDTIRIGRHSEQGPFADADGEAVRIVGAGRGATELGGGVDLGEDGSSIAGLTVRDPGATALALRGAGQGLHVVGGVRLRDGSALRSSAVDGAVTTAGAVTMHSVAVAGSGIDVESGALTARHLTVYGAGAAGMRVAGGANASVADSIVWGFARGFAGAVSASRSDYPEAPGAVDPRFVAPPSNLGLGAGSPLVDAGDPAPLAATEPEADAVGQVRIMDGDGNGTARRDVGALERRPPRPPGTRGNLLANPGAEQGTAATDDRASPAPPRWTRTGAFTSVRYGTVSGAFAFPTLPAAALLVGGDAFFAGGPAGAASMRQVVDVARWAPEIDARGGGRVRLSALLGGFRASEDHAVVSATFRSSFGVRVGSVTLDTVTATERGHATMLAARSAVRAIPRLTRTITVTVRARAPGGSYNDAYVDDIALVPRIAPLRGLPRPRGKARRPFAGAAVISARVRVDRHRRARVRLACPSGTVGICGGVVTLARRRTVILGARRIALRPGQIRRLRIQLSRRERRALKRRTPGHVYVAARDAQGLTRTITAPVRILRR